MVIVHFSVFFWNGGGRRGVPDKKTGLKGNVWAYKRNPTPSDEETNSQTHQINTDEEEGRQEQAQGSLVWEVRHLFDGSDDQGGLQDQGQEGGQQT